MSPSARPVTAPGYYPCGLELCTLLDRLSPTVCDSLITVLVTFFHFETCHDRLPLLIASTVPLLQDALMKTRDVYQPVDLGKQMQDSVLDVSCHHWIPTKATPAGHAAV